MLRRRMLTGAAALVGVLVVAGLGDAASCTKGIDCYCDRVQGGDLNDPALLMCEDFEARTLYENTGFGNGAPYWGPWYDHTGSGAFPCFRGRNSYWSRTYGVGAQGTWTEGQPASPALGCTCNTSGAGVCFNHAWVPGDPYQGDVGSRKSSIAIFRNGDFDDDVPAEGAGPTGTSGGGAGVFDGLQSFAHRVGAGTGNSAGIKGTKSWGGLRTEIGITMAVAYAKNSVASGIWAYPWKGNQLVASTGRTDGVVMGNVAFNQGNPFHAVFLYTTGGAASQALCNSSIAAATKTRGRMSCNDVALNYEPLYPSQYRRDVDWPLGSWGCVRIHYQNLGTSNTTLRLWLTTAATISEKSIIDITGLNTTFLRGANGYSGWTWNAHSNANQGGRPTPTSQMTFRYEDNIHIRAGAPVSCSQIGQGPATTPPGPTANMRFPQMQHWLAGLGPATGIVTILALGHLAGRRGGRRAQSSPASSPS